MSKLLLLLAVTILVVYLIKRGSRRGRDVQGPEKPAAEVEDMVRCHVCGVNLPRSEALMSKGRLYCCDRHLHQDQQ